MPKQPIECPGSTRGRLGRLGALLALGLSPLRAAPADFVHEVVPILRQHCAQCHAGEKRKGGFSMNTRESFLAGGENGPVASADRSSDSVLIRRLLSEDPDFRMPPEGERVSAEQIQRLRQWIDDGLVWTPGFAFKKPAYDPPLRPRQVELPPAAEGRPHPVDRILDAYLLERNKPRPGPIGDGAFLRRASLDLIGLLPTPEALERFVSDQTPDKRTRLVRELLANDLAYTEHWLTFWNDLLRNDYTGTGYIDGGRKQISAWLYRSLQENKPYDRMVRELVAPAPESEGFARGIRWRGEVSAGQSVPVQFAQSVGQAFLGINLKCASCHDSFIDRWKLEESFGLAAIYSDKPLELHRCDKALGRMAQPAWLFPELGQVDASRPPAERLRQLAALITHPENGRLARTLANRLWRLLMGRGIVHPPDAMQSEPWNADLLDCLAAHLAANQYDLKKLLEFICASQAYQSQTEAVEAGSEDHAYVYGGPRPRRLTAEQFVDAVWQITGAAPQKHDAPVVRGGTNASAGAKLQLAGRWVWASSAREGSLPPAGEAISLRKKFELDRRPVQAGAAITCDNSYVLYINGRKAQSDENWEQAEAVVLDSFLVEGRNEILIVARNGGAEPNPAGVWFEARLRFADGAERTLATDGSWEWTRALPDGQGRFVQESADWQAAVVLADPAIWNARLGGALAPVLAQAALAPRAMVRASLMNSDLLMRALGRPNREQIVSVRPSDLTTLEAMDLSNGQLLADWLESGARTLAARRWASNEAFTRWLYAFALARPPTSDELAAVRMPADRPMTPPELEDLLWAVCALPEFQFVR